MSENHDQIIREKKLPRVGNIVKSKKYGTLWRVVEKREGVKGTAPMSTGMMMGYEYTLHDNTFETHWDIVEG